MYQRPTTNTNHDFPGGVLSPTSATETPTPIFRDCLEVDEVVQLLSEENNPEFDLKVFSKIFALDYGENNLLENVENSEKHIRAIENSVFEFVYVVSEDEFTTDEELSEEEEDDQNEETPNSVGDYEDRIEDRIYIDKEENENQGDEFLAYFVNHVMKQEGETNPSSVEASSSNNNNGSNDNENELAVKEGKDDSVSDNDDEELTIAKTEPTSSKLNILNLSSLDWAIYEHPDRVEVKNIMYFSNVSKCKLFRERQFIGISEIINSFYGKGIQFPSFVIFQILFSIVEKLCEMDNAGKIKRIPNIEQDEHLFHIYRNRHVERYHVIEKLFLDNIEISPKLKTAEFGFHDQIGLSQFIDVNILENFEKIVQDLDLCESDILFCLGIFMMEMVFSTTNASRMIFKILSQPYNEPLICEMLLQNNRSNWSLIRIILSMLRINEPFRLVPKPFYEKPTVEDENFIPRITLENLVGIEMAHVCTILAEDRKIFEYFTAPFIIKLTEPQFNMLNNPFHPSSYKYVATTDNGKKIDLLYCFFAGVILYGTKKMEEAEKYLRQSILHPENDIYAKNVSDQYDSSDHKEYAETIVNEIMNICNNNSSAMQQDITNRFVKAQTKLPFFTYVSYSFLAKALAEMKKYPLSLYYTECSLICSRMQQTSTSPIFNASAIFTKAYIVHKYDIFDISSDLYSQVITNYKGHSMAHNNRGICLKRLRHNDEAIKEYEMSLRIDPSNHLAFNNRAMYFYSDEEHENSMLYYKMAIRLKPTYPLPITNLGLTLTQLNKFTDAIDLLTKVLIWSPTNVNALITRGFCHMRKNNFEDALADYSRLVNELESEERSTLFNMSLCYYHTQRYREAVYYATKIITKNPKDERALYYRSLFFEQCAKMVEAFDDVNAFLELSPANPSGIILRDRLLAIVNKITRIS